jgi:HipA-like C-terminal domain
MAVCFRKPTRGIRSPETWAERIGNVPCLISKRYDRVQGASGEIVRRLHQEDFCQALGYPSSRKYQQEGGPSLRECFQMIRVWSTTPVLDIRHMLDAVIFAAVTGNADAHGKNHSFLYVQDTRRMAPLYDQVCTLSNFIRRSLKERGSLAHIFQIHFRSWQPQQLDLPHDDQHPDVNPEIRDSLGHAIEVGKPQSTENPAHHEEQHQPLRP